VAGLERFVEIRGKDKSPRCKTGTRGTRRELVVAGTPYILPYRVRGEAVEILRVFDAAGKWPEKL